jgi:hypothetical protein
MSETTEQKAQRLRQLMQDPTTLPSAILEIMDWQTILLTQLSAQLGLNLEAPAKPKRPALRLVE